MELGNHLEDAVIEYFQNVILKEPITDRNTETKWGYDEKIRYKLDGKTKIKGEPVIFENKISNSQSYKFTENKGYHIQVQAYMLCENLNKTILAGLYQGKPIYKVIDRDEELIQDIKKMTDFVVSALNGLVDFYNDYPVDLLEKYSNSKLYKKINCLNHWSFLYFFQPNQLNLCSEKNTKLCQCLSFKQIRKNTIFAHWSIWNHNNIIGYRHSWFILVPITSTVWVASFR
jgi:GR25 family glycosyltransferase involved in LPS biosynthesis